jgi:hypothetical protein
MINGTVVNILGKGRNYLRHAKINYRLTIPIFFVDILIWETGHFVLAIIFSATAASLP